MALAGKNIRPDFLDAVTRSRGLLGDKRAVEPLRRLWKSRDAFRKKVDKYDKQMWEDQCPKYRGYYGGKYYCSKCGKTLEYMGNPTGSLFRGGSAFKRVEQWHGNVCLHCNKVLCSLCIELGGPSSCPRCGKPTEAAIKHFVEKLSRG